VSPLRGWHSTHIRHCVELRGRSGLDQRQHGPDHLGSLRKMDTTPASESLGSALLLTTISCTSNTTRA
jgi:hypothetical protein